MKVPLRQQVFRTESPVSGYHHAACHAQVPGNAASFQQTASHIRIIFLKGASVRQFAAVDRDIAEDLTAVSQHASAEQGRVVEEPAMASYPDFRAGPVGLGGKSAFAELVLATDQNIAVRRFEMAAGVQRRFNAIQIWVGEFPG